MSGIRRTLRRRGLVSAGSHEQLVDLEQMMKQIAEQIAPVFEVRNAGFALLGFTFGEGGWSTFVSNANRGDMVKALREAADVLEAEGELPPHAPGDPEAA